MNTKEIAVQYLGEYLQSRIINTKRHFLRIFNRKQPLFVDAHTYYNILIATSFIHRLPICGCKQSTL